MRMMMDYPWPGNVREMINAVEHAYICAVDNAVVPESLPQDIRHHTMGASYTGIIDMPQIYGRRHGDAPLPKHAGTAVAHMGSPADDIIQALNATKGNKSAAAKALGIDRTTLWRRMRKYGLA